MNFFSSEIVYEKYEKLGLEGFFSLAKSDDVLNVVYAIKYHQEELAKVNCKVVKNDIYFDVECSEYVETLSNAYRLFLVQYIVELLIRKHLGRRLYLVHWKNELLNEFQKSLFYPKGKYYMRLVEPTRSFLDNSCFDDFGYIIHQGKMSNISFGAYSTKEKGCGWIAVYNVMRYLGHEKNISEVIEELGQMGLKNKRFGENLYVMAWYLKKNGIPVNISPLLKGPIMYHMQHSECGILLYMPSKSAHYTMYHRDKDRFRFVNAVYGKKDLYMKIPQFFKEYQKYPYQYLVYIPSRNDLK